MQVCDLSGTPRELAGDSDRILPGEGDFPLGPIIEHLARIGYDGHVSLEVLNPHLWQVDPDRVADLGRQALSRVLGPWETEPCGIKRRVLGVSSVVTLQPAAVVFREEQYFDWRIYTFIALAEMLTGLGLSRGRVWSLEFGLGLAIGLGLLMVVIIFLLHMTTEVTPSDLRVWFGWIPTYRRYRADRHDSIRRSRHLPADRRLRLLGHSIRPRRRASADRARQSRRPARADRRIKAPDRQPAARAAGRGDRPLARGTGI